MLTRYPQGLAPDNKGYVDAKFNVHATRTVFNRRTLIVPLNFADGTTTVTTNLTLPVGIVVLPYPFVNVRTAEAVGGTKTLSVGVTGTTGAFITGLSVASTGLKGTSLASGTVTLGSFLIESVTGTTTGDARVPYIIGTAIALTWTPASSDWTAFDGDLLLPVYQMVDLTQMPVNADIANIDTGL